MKGYITKEIVNDILAKTKHTKLDQRVYNFFNRDVLSVLMAKAGNKVVFWSERAPMPRYIEQYVRSWLRRRLPKGTEISVFAYE